MSQLAANNVKVVICAVYRSGSTDVKLFEYVESVMDTVRSEGSRIILAGDFNVHNCQWLNSTRTKVAGEYAEDMCILHGLEQHVTMPTRRNNTLDLIMSDFPLRVTVTTQPPLGASDHVVVIADFPALVPKEPLTHRTVWRYNHADWDRLRHFYTESDWETLITGDPDQSCESVTSLILSGMRKFIPSRALVSRPSDPSWWTSNGGLPSSALAESNGTLPSLQSAVRMEQNMCSIRIRQIALVNTLLLSAASTRTTSLIAISLPHDSVHRGSSATFISARLQYSANYSDSLPTRQLAPTTYLPEF